MMTTWDCPVCSLVNDDLDDRCRDCRTDRPAAQPELIDRAQLPAKPPPGPTRCPQCGSAAYLGTAAAGACSVCGHDSRKLPARSRSRQRARRRSGRQ